jgi:hypothetical protein
MPCATFRVSAPPSVASLVLYTSGLGRTLLSETPTDGGSRCPDAKGLRDRITLAKDNSGASIDRFVAIQADSNPLSTPGASMQGTVIALAGTKKVGESALKVERSPREESWTAITWVLSVLIPAGITFLIARAALKLDARWKEDSEFREFRLKIMSRIIEFLEKVHAVIRSPQQHPGQTIFWSHWNVTYSRRCRERSRIGFMTPATRMI